jgi:hypothetical protein
MHRASAAIPERQAADDGLRPRAPSLLRQARPAVARRQVLQLEHGPKPPPGLKNLRAARRKPKASLDPRIARDLQNSGLSLAHATKMGVRLTPRSSFDQSPESYDLPYFDLDGEPIAFARCRYLDADGPFAWDKGDGGKPRKYGQPPRSKNHFYLAPLLDRPWRAVAEDRLAPIVFVEGEKKAASGCAHGVAVIGLGGVWNWRTREHRPLADFEAFDWQDRDVVIAFDADPDPHKPGDAVQATPQPRQNPGIFAATNKLAAELANRGAKVRIAQFDLLPADTEHPNGRKCGLDDLLVAGGIEAVRAVLAAATPWTDEIERFNAHNALVEHGNDVVFLTEDVDETGRPDVRLRKKQAMADLHANKKTAVRTMAKVQGGGEVEIDKLVPFFPVWLAHPQRRTLKGVVLDPAGKTDSSLYYNLWQGFAVEPREGDCEFFLEHVREVITGGDDRLYQYVVRWMAHAVQRPWELPGTALVLRGGEGTGKGVFASNFGKLFGHHYVQVSSADHATGRFNAHMKHAMVLFMDEAVWAGDPSARGRLYSYITEEMKAIEQKGIDPIWVRNLMRVIIASNHEWVVPADGDSRRWVVMDVNDQRQNDHAYWTDFINRLDAGGQEALLHFLLNVDLDGFNPREIPKTRALLDQKLRNLHGLKRWWLDVLHKGQNTLQGGWAEEAPRDWLVMVFKEADREGLGRKGSVKGLLDHSTELGMNLKRLLPPGIEQSNNLRPVGPNGTRVRVWRFPPLDVCRRHFALNVLHAERVEDVFAPEDESAEAQAPKRARKKAKP